VTLHEKNAFRIGGALSLRRVANRSAYSLLEVVLSIGLVAILTSALSFASHSFMRFQKNARVAQERSLALRSFLEDITRDIRGVTSMKIDSNLLATGSIAESEDIGRESMLQWESSGDVDLVPFYGTANAVYFSTQAWNGYLDRESLPISWTSNKNGVAWLSSSADSVRMPLLIGRSGLSEVLFRTERGKQGVCRYRVSPSQTWLTSTHDDMVSLSFRYWDGGQWFSHWDSLELQSLPRAIEIKIVTQYDDGTPLRTVVSLFNGRD
jgi:type II secretory pathway pseudopilin PulG